MNNGSAVWNAIENSDLKSFVGRIVLGVVCLICLITQACLGRNREGEGESSAVSRVSDVDGFPDIRWPSMMRALRLKCEGMMYMEDSCGVICKDMLAARALYTDQTGLGIFVFSFYRKENGEWAKLGEAELTLRMQPKECVVLNKSASDGASVRVVDYCKGRKRGMAVVQFGSYLCAFHLLPLSEVE